MMPPYILIDDGDITLFKSITTLEQYIESPDVDRYTVFDSVGRRLYFESSEKQRENRGFGVVSVAPVRLSRSNNENIFEKEYLLTTLSQFLKQLTGSEINTNDLSSILRRVQELIGITE